jgi:hypothetical protein
MCKGEGRGVLGIQEWRWEDASTAGARVRINGMD